MYVFNDCQEIRSSFSVGYGVCKIFGTEAYSQGRGRLGVANGCSYPAGHQNLAYTRGVLS